MLKQLVRNWIESKTMTRVRLRLAPCDKLIYTIGGLILWAIFSSLYLPLSIFGGIYRTCVVISAKCFQPDLIPISYKDAFFAALYACDRQPLMNVGTSLRVQGRLETEHLMNRFKECFLSGDEETRARYANLYCYFQMYGGYVFKRRVHELVLENHFIEKILGEEEVDAEDYISKWLVTNTFGEDSEMQPCWQVLILRRALKDGQEETIVSVKMHHGMIDGYSIVHMIDKLTNSSSPYIVTNPKKESLFTKLRHVLQAPAVAFDVFIRLRPWCTELMKQGNPFQPDWVMSFSTLDQVTEVKEIRKTTGGKFATVMMTAITGALKRMYIQDKKYRLEDLPDKIWMESPLGLPNHPSMTKGGTFCNHFTAGIYGTPLRTNDMRYRLQELERDFNSWEAHSGMQVMLWVVYTAYWLQPAWLVRKFYTNALSYLWRFSVLYSGLISSPKKVSLLGHQVENVYFLQATASAFPYVSLFLMCSTYDGKLDVSCYASKEVVENKQELERLIQVHLKNELKEMHLEYCSPESKNSTVALEIGGGDNE